MIGDWVLDENVKEVNINDITETWEAFIADPYEWLFTENDFIKALRRLGKDENYIAFVLSLDLE